MPLEDLMRQALHVIISYIWWIVLGGVLYLVPFQLGLFNQIEILFYRGIVDAAVISAALFLLISIVTLTRSKLARIFCPGFSFRDSFAIALNSMALCITFLIVFPVTIDRSVTVFLLGEMSRAPDAAVTATELDGRLRQRYIEELHAVDRRMKEQIVTGNVEQHGDKYILTDQGKRFLQLSGWIARIFHTDATLLKSRDKSDS